MKIRDQIIQLISGGLDFWGIDDDCFDLSLQSTQARFIRIRLTENECLHFRSFQVFAKSQENIEVVISQDKYAFMSSSNNPKGARSVLSKDGGFCHSEKENNPWWVIDLGESYSISRIKIKNRDDDWAFRMRSFVVDCSTDLSSWQVIHSNLGQSNLTTLYIRFLDALDQFKDYFHKHSDSLYEMLKTLRLEMTESRLISASAQNIGLHKIKLLTFFCSNDVIENLGKHSYLKPQALFILSCLLDQKVTWKDEYSNIYKTALSLYLALNIDSKGLRSKNVSGLVFALRYKRYWNSSNDLEFIESNVNLMLNLIGSQEVLSNQNLFLTRHGFVKRQSLVKQRESYVCAIQETIKIFKKIGFEIVISYGTLLGAVRENAFIAHDDDVDMLLLLPARSQEEMIGLLVEIKAKLKEMDIVFANNPTMNFHVRPLKSQPDIFIDIFPSWVEGDKVKLYMQKMQFGEVNYSTVYPANYVKLYDQELPSPSKPVQFLKDRYGETWNIPNRFFELVA